jgi:hypothetical protein
MCQAEPGRGVIYGISLRTRNRKEEELCAFEMFAVAF